MPNSRGGDGVGDGVCYGGEDGGGVDRKGIRGNPFLINWTLLCGEACVAASSSLKGGLISGLYSRPFLLLSLNKFPLRIPPKIQVIS